MEIFFKSWNIFIRGKMWKYPYFLKPTAPDLGRIKNRTIHGESI